MKTQKMTKPIKVKEPSKKVIRRAIRKQLSLLGRNIKTINQMLDTLKELRPIVRGKKNAETEFGSKVSISRVDGITYVEELSWNNYNKRLTLKASVEKYKERFGFYLKAVIADKTYRNRDNIKYCKELNIRLSGPALGRPNSTVPEIDKKQAYEDSRIRNSVEGKFGEGKRFYGLGRIMSKLKSTAETEILLQFVVMNLERKLRVLFCKILEMVFSCTIIRRKIFYLRLFS